MKLATTLVAVVLCSTGIRAQVPVKCLEIEGILVDACISATDCPASTEGMNEMVRFITGPAPIALGDLQFQFYSSTFRGIAQDATTASLTAQLNASVEACGHLLEPPGGVIPPGSRVIFVTSTAMCVQANSFTALNDTLYIIYQNAGNSQGHFKNNDLVGQPVTTVPAAPLIRWLRISVTGAACGDTATYDANQLVNIYGTYGGLSGENDGASVEFSWPGQPVPTYVNYGCQAPFVPTLATVVSGGGVIPCGSSANLVGSVSGGHVAVIWQGGGGSFSSPSDTITSYTPGGGDNGDVELSFCAITACGDTICGQVTVTTGATPQVTVSGDTTLCTGFETSVLTASGADTYLWSTGATGPSIVAAITGPMDYWVVGTNACGSDTGYISPRWMHTTTYYENVTCTGAADGTLLAHQTGGVQPYTYSWSTGSTDSLITGLAPGSYSYTVTDADGCTMTGAYTITEPPVLTATVGADTTICAGGQAVLSAQASGGTPGYTYTWSPEGPLVSPTETTTYSVVVMDNNGCTGEAVGLSTTVYVGSGTVSFTNTSPVGCLPHCVTFTADTATGATYAWTFGDGATSTDPVAEHCYTEEGIYSVSLLMDSGDGCPGSNTMTDLVHVGASPMADFAWLPDTPTAGSPDVQFTDLSDGATSWAWSFGDPAGSVSDEASPAFSFPGAGCYPVSLVVANDAGCADSTLQQLCVLGTDSLVVPNVFSPNGDGQNDVFRVTGGGLTALDVQFFNRWGQEVGRIDRVQQVWNGRDMAGQALVEGTYFYILHAVGNSGTEHRLHGTVTLLR